MDDVTQLPGAHAKPAEHRDHLWVLVIIALCALMEVFASWVFIGSMSGFPRIGGSHGLPTDWTLAVTQEAYWAYALYCWLAGAPGPRSRRFAMWSAVAVFVLSLIGQGASHLVPIGTKPSPFLVVFVTSLPVLVLALIAILIHLRQLDREESAEAAEAAEAAERQAALERAEADERITLRADLAAAREELGAERSARETAENDAAEALRRAEKATAKLAAMSDQKPRKKPAEESAQGDDMTTELRALMELKADPELTKPRMGGELARRLGVSAATGRRLHGRLAAGVAAELAAGERSGERSPVQPDAGYGERS